MGFREDEQPHHPGGGAHSDAPGFGDLPAPVALPHHDDGKADAGVLAGVPAGAGHQVPVGVGPGALTRSSAAVEDLTVVGDACGQLPDDGLDEAARTLLAARVEAERSLVLVLADALQRGLVAASDSGSPRQWVTDRVRPLEPPEVTRVVKAAHAINAPDNAGLRALFVAGELNACQLATVVDQLPQAMAALPDACRDEVIGYYLDAVKGGCGRRELRILTRRIVHRLDGSISGRWWAARVAGFRRGLALGRSDRDSRAPSKGSTSCKWWAAQPTLFRRGLGQRLARWFLSPVEGLNQRSVVGSASHRVSTLRYGRNRRWLSAGVFLGEELTVLGTTNRLLLRVRHR